MRMIKGILFVFAGLFILVTLISLLIPGRVAVTRAVSVQGDPLKLFNEISDLKKWEDWQPVFKEHPAGLTYSAMTDRVNSFAEWTTNGKKNKLVITEKKYPYVKISLQRAGEHDVENLLSLLPVQEQGNMQVQWQSITKLKWYPWEKFGGIFTEKMTGPGYEASLQSLKKFIETP